MRLIVGVVRGAVEQAWSHLGSGKKKGERGRRTEKRKPGRGLGQRGCK